MILCANHCAVSTLLSCECLLHDEHSVRGKKRFFVYMAFFLY